MSRVTYLWGAGASYGVRAMKDGKIEAFHRGLPVVNELQRALQLLQTGGVSSGVFVPANEAQKQGVSSEQFNMVRQKLALLAQACASFPTIDTLAKQLFVTQRPLKLSDTAEPLSYDYLKQLLSVALLMMQNETKRDLRYDGFIASLIKRDRSFPPMTILSWNYDVQFEMAYSGYYREERYIPSLWKELNVYNKMYPTDFDVQAPFAMIKLNGTALFKNAAEKKWEVNGKQVERITDCFYGSRPPKTPYQYGYEYLTGTNYTNMLSYAWETDHTEELKQVISQRVRNTRELVVIGYSFPYVNNEMDSYILQHMPALDKVVVQDKNFEDIKERIEGILESTYRKVSIIPKNSLQQFYIPNMFVKS